LLISFIIDFIRVLTKNNIVLSKLDIGSSIMTTLLLEVNSGLFAPLTN